MAVKNFLTLVEYFSRLKKIHALLSYSTSINIDNTITHTRFINKIFRYIRIAKPINIEPII